MVETITYKGFEIKVEREHYPEDPRYFYDYAGRIATYNDSHVGFNECELIGATAKNGYLSWSSELKWYIFNVKMHAILPLYESNGIYSTESVQGNQIGFIYMPKDRFKERYFNQDCIPDIYKKDNPDITIRQVCEIILKGEVETFNDYKNGEVYGWTIEFPEETESCWGYYGEDHEKSGVIESAMNSIDCYLRHQRVKHFNKLRAHIKHRVPLINRTPCAYA